jgi:threonine dehydrogenase-like Zn-dependent dehydrogenase
MIDRDLAEGTRLKPPRVIGHEGIGIVAEVGSSVANVKVGDQAVSETTVRAYGLCCYCRTGRDGMCVNNGQGLGTGEDGYFAECVIADALHYHTIPDHVDPIAAAVLEPFGSAVKGVTQHAEVAPGKVVVVFGPGTIGSAWHGSQSSPVRTWSW